jgi:hypothetical protein
VGEVFFLGETGITRMYMRVDEPGKDDLSRGIDYFVDANVHSSLEEGGDFPIFAKDIYLLDTLGSDNGTVLDE